MSINVYQIVIKVDENSDFKISKFDENFRRDFRQELKNESISQLFENVDVIPVKPGTYKFSVIPNYDIDEITLFLRKV